MSNRKGQRGQQKQQNQCIKCKQQIPQELIMCAKCQDLGYCTAAPQAVSENYNSIGKGTLHGGGSAKKQTAEKQIVDDDFHKERALQKDQQETVSKSKRKKGKKKIKQSLDHLHGQKQNGNESMKDGEYEKTLKKGDDKNKKATATPTVGENFGEGWWKPNPTVKKTEVGDECIQKAVGSETADGEMKLKYKDFYSDSEDESEDIKDKEKPKIGKSSAPVSAAVPASEASVEEALSALQIEKDGNSKKSKGEKKETSSDQDASKWGKCSYCKKKGLVLKCSRCQLSTYCNRSCQKSDYPQHKVICKRKELFNLMQSKIPEVLKLSFVIKYGSFEVSPYLADLPEEFPYALGKRGVVMAEIIGPYFHIFRHGIVIRDLAGEETHLLFYSQTDIYLHVTSDRVPVPLPLAMCLTPGNFILLLDTHWHAFLDGTVGIRINNLDEVYFIFRK